MYSLNKRQVYSDIDLLFTSQSHSRDYFFAALKCCITAGSCLSMILTSYSYAKWSPIQCIHCNVLHENVPPLNANRQTYTCHASARISEVRLQGQRVDMIFENAKLGFYHCAIFENCVKTTFSHFRLSERSLPLAMVILCRPQINHK